MALTLAWIFGRRRDRLFGKRDSSRRAGNRFCKAAYNTTARLRSHLSMTLAPRRFFIRSFSCLGLNSAGFFRSFDHHIVCVLASGIVSLTLKPLMCARIVGELQAGHKRHPNGKMDRRFHPARYRRDGRGWKFLDRGLADSAILLVCISRSLVFLQSSDIHPPSVGDSGSARRSFHRAGRSSPEQMSAFQEAGESKKSKRRRRRQNFQRLLVRPQQSAAIPGIIFCYSNPARGTRHN